MRLTEEQKKNRGEFIEIRKRLDKEAGRDRIKYHGDGDGYRTFVLFGGTEVSIGGWLIGRKWMTAKFMNKIVDKWVMQSYKTRADNLLKTHKVPDNIDIKRLQEIDKAYDLSAGCSQCGGCEWFAALDSDYGFCFNQNSPNEGRITFEHGGCIEHSFIQKLLKETCSPQDKTHKRGFVPEVRNSTRFWNNCLFCSKSLFVSFWRVYHYISVRVYNEEHKWIIQRNLESGFGS